MAESVRTNAEQSARTRALLVTAARQSFATFGYGATSTVEVVKSARVTRGALYHHFPDKVSLFEAVYVEVDTEVMDRMGTAAREADCRDALSTLRAALAGFLEACLDTDVQQIILRDGVSVLGWHRWLTLETDAGLGQLAAVLERCQQEGVVATNDPWTLAHLILGALMQGGLLIAGSTSPVAAQSTAVAELDALLDGLRPGGPASHER